MAEAPTSKSQARALRLSGLPAVDTYAAARAALEAAGLPGDGVPGGHDWRSAGKLADEALVVLLKPDPMVAARTATAPAAARPQTWGDQIRASKARERQNRALRAAGYRWERRGVPNQSPLALDDWDPAWVLVGPDGAPVALAAALAAIGA